MHTRPSPIQPALPGAAARATTQPGPGGAIYHFGKFTLCPARKLLACGGRPVVLGGRAFDLLVALVIRAGEVVGQRDLVTAVWPHAVVEENGLRVHMSALRKALGEWSTDQYIVTVPGRGYCFVKQVCPGAALRAHAPLAGWSTLPPLPAVGGTRESAPAHVDTYPPPLSPRREAGGEAAAWQASQSEQSVYVFGAFRLLRQARQLCRGAAPVRLGGRAVDLLFALVERAGEVVSRAELERLIWPNSIVEDSCLRVHIGALRKALEEGLGEERFIANVPGRGYSFVAPVVVVRPQAMQAPAALFVEQLLRIAPGVDFANTSCEPRSADDACLHGSSPPTCPSDDSALSQRCAIRLCDEPHGALDAAFLASDPEAVDPGTRCR